MVRSAGMMSRQAVSLNVPPSAPASRYQGRYSSLNVSLRVGFSSKLTFANVSAHGTVHAGTTDTEVDTTDGSVYAAKLPVTLTGSRMPSVRLSCQQHSLDVLREGRRTILAAVGACLVVGLAHKVAEDARVALCCSLV
jgi:hypothetical protein